MNREILGARYRVEKTDHTSAKTSRETLILWRLGNDVAHERPESGLTEVWRRLEGRDVEYRRYDDRAQRLLSVSTQFGVVDEWPSRYQLLAPEALDKMRLLEESGSGCKRVQKYRVELGTGALTVWWNPDLQLVLLLDRAGPAVSTTMKLADIESAGSAIAATFNRRLAYPKKGSPSS